MPGCFSKCVFDIYITPICRNVLLCRNVLFYFTPGAAVKSRTAAIYPKQEKKTYHRLLSEITGKSCKKFFKMAAYYMCSYFIHNYFVNITQLNR